MSLSELEIKLNPILLAKIQNYMNDPVYRETIENAATFNARLSADRTSRLPFLDSQTGVAQNHSSLWMDARERMPGLREGQVYTYPAKRWRKKRRQYLHNFMQPRYPAGMPRKPDPDDSQPPTSAIECPNGTNSGITGLNDEIKDIIPKEEVKPPESWYFDDLDIPDSGEFDEPDADSDYDYEESYNRRKKKKPTTKAPRQGNSRGRRKITYDAVTDPEKPFSCDICGARYKTRPGLTYHYSHSHKEKEDDQGGTGEDEMLRGIGGDESSAARRSGGNHRSGVSSLIPPPPILHPQQQPPTHPMQQIQQQPPTLQPQQSPHPGMGIPSGPPSHPNMMIPPHLGHSHHPPHLIPQQPPPHLMSHPGMQSPPRGHSPLPPPLASIMGMNPNAVGPLPIPIPGPSTHESQLQLPPQVPSDECHKKSNESQASGSCLKPRVTPSHYCDFCLGDAVENKKSGSPEELVSCSDCGRSGHPSCLQFTANMIISVKKYRWQCIECKCCSICGTSDNDDQLLFCDDCDRGYHMYCLKPPLDAPPEGSWSCSLCIAEFHQNR